MEKKGEKWRRTELRGEGQRERNNEKEEDRHLGSPTEWGRGGQR